MSETEIFIKNFFDVVEKLYNVVPGLEDGFGVDFLKIKRKADEQKNDPSFSCKAGQSDENRKKNRYKDILPFDYTRVKLTGNNNKSDYINASYIRRGTNEQCYIAAQGPLPHTVIDFWTMIWCCRVKVILMVCKEIEVGRRKCEKYWADENDNCKNFGEFKIQFKSQTQDCKDYVIRSLQITYRNESRLITQLHYTTWPDHGIPKTRGSILQMLSAARSLQSYQCDKLQPLCIHCSAGCGRTGAVLAIDHFRYLIAIKRLEGSVFDVVTEMRKQRSSMVQTKDQYELVHLAVSEMLSMFGKDPDLFQNHKPRPPTTNNYVNVQIPAVDNKPRGPLSAPNKPSRSGQSRSSFTAAYDSRPLSTVNKIPPPKPALARRTSDTTSVALNLPSTHKKSDSGQLDLPAVTSSPTSSASIKERYNLKPVANSKKTSTSSMTSQVNRFNSVSTLDLREKQSKGPAASSLSIHDLTKVELMTSQFNQSFKRNGVDTSSTIEEKKQSTKQEPVVKKPLTSSAEKKSGFAYSNGVYTEVVVGAPPIIKPKPSIRKKEMKKEPLKISDANNRVSDQQKPSRASLKSLLHSNKATPAKLSPPKPARRSQLITNPQPATRSIHHPTDTDQKSTADYKTGFNQPPPVKPKRSSRPITTKQPPATTKQPPATTKQPPATTKQPPATTKQPPATTKQPPATTRIPEAKRRIHSNLSETRGNIYSKVDDGHHANHQPSVPNSSPALYSQLNVKDVTTKRAGPGPQQRTTTKLPEVEEVAPEIPERTPESYQVVDGFHGNRYESIRVAKQQQQPSVASGDSVYATISEAANSNQQTSLGSTVKARAMGLLEKTTTAFQFTTSSTSKTPSSESVGSKSSAVGEAYVQEPFIYSEQDLSYNNRYQRKPHGGRKLPEKWTSSGIL